MGGKRERKGGEGFFGGGAQQSEPIQLHRLYRFRLIQPSYVYASPHPLASADQAVLSEFG